MHGPEFAFNKSTLNQLSDEQAEELSEYLLLEETYSGIARVLCEEARILNDDLVARAYGLRSSRPSLPVEEKQELEAFDKGLAQVWPPHDMLYQDEVLLAVEERMHTVLDRADPDGSYLLTRAKPLASGVKNLAKQYAEAIVKIFS